jgi:hypothetical protein
MNKKCTCCGINKLITKFRCIGGNRKYGRFEECKDCMDSNYKNTIIKEQGIESWNKYLFNNFKDRIRSRTRSAFRRIKEDKPTKTEDLLGCNWLQAKEHIESFFNDDLNWDNFSEWHIDHIKPLCLANNIDELLPLCRYENLQPLIAKDNLIKGGRY